MNILYGACGAGMGHVMRSAVLAQHLQEAGHQVTFASHDGGLRYLKHRKWRTIQVAGLTGSKVSRNAVSPLGTLVSSVIQMQRGSRSNLLASVEMTTLMPDVVITDFEATVARYAMLMNKPLIAVDNFHFLNHCRHPSALISSDYSAASFMYSVCESRIPFAHKYLITTFASAPVLRPTTTLHLPILRPEVLRAKTEASPGEHLVAYFNDKADHASIAEVLKTAGMPVRLYGSARAPATDGPVTFCEFSDADFIRDVATSRAVIGGSGFTFMTEAIFLGKPMLALPYEMQFEQILNANYLEALGYGERCHSLTPESLRSFLEQVPRYAGKLQGFRHDGNRELFASVNRAIREVA